MGRVRADADYTKLEASGYPRPGDRVGRMRLWGQITRGVALRVAGRRAVHRGSSFPMPVSSGMLISPAI